MATKKPLAIDDATGLIREIDLSEALPVANIPAMVGATAGSAGTAGLVPAPASGDEEKVLTGGATYMPIGLAAQKKSNLSATVAPGVSDDLAAGYDIGSLWVDVVANTSYTCVDATAGAAIWERRGQDGAPGQAIVARDHWSSSVAYVVGDGIDHNGSSYFAKVNNTNQEPPNETYWQLLASKGDPGTPGSGLEITVPATISNNIVNLDMELGTVFTTTLSQYVSYINILHTPQGVASTVTWIVTQASDTPYPIYLPEGMVWAGGQDPDFSTPSAIYVLVFKTVDGGSNWVAASVGSGGGGITGFTPGSVLFVGPDGTPSEDPTGFYYDPV
ncbi:MAG TPA: hypothetical protein DCS88_10415, partial [Alphaproteobacteria bacterium]|nr:hypothetical protein [Alphaproteobacteria bacterium]